IRLVEQLCRRRLYHHIRGADLYRLALEPAAQLCARADGDADLYCPIHPRSRQARAKNQQPGRRLLNSFDPARSRTVALEAGLRLASLVDADGRFIYRYDAVTGTRSDDYNLTRHVCAIWASAILARRLHAPQLLEPLNRAAHWLIDRHM